MIANALSTTCGASARCGSGSARAASAWVSAAMLSSSRSNDSISRVLPVAEGIGTERELAGVRGICRRVHGKESGQRYLCSQVEGDCARSGHPVESPAFCASGGSCHVVGPQSLSRRLSEGDGALASAIADRRRVRADERMMSIACSRETPATSVSQTIDSMPSVARMASTSR